MKRILLVACITGFGLFTLAGCVSQETKSDAAPSAAAPAPAAKPAAGKQGYEDALASANAEIAKADSMGGEWRDTGKVLKKAAAAAEKGDYAEAAKLANKAEFQAKMGQSQAQAEAGVGNPAYLY